MMVTPGDARQFTLPPLVTRTINLNVDRAKGENLPDISGKFFYVDQCDLPCFASFGTDNEYNSVSLSAGLQINDTFSGIKLFHGDYSNTNSGKKTNTLKFFVGGEPRSVNQFVNPQFQVSLPCFKSNNSTVFTASFPIPNKSKLVKIEGYCVTSTASGTTPQSCTTGVIFRDNENLASGLLNSFVHGNVNYNALCLPGVGISSPLFIGLSLGLSLWAYPFSRAIGVPAETVSCDLFFSFSFTAQTFVPNLSDFYSVIS